jgi:drug/metabolite transporter (DMT)-like permease
MISKGAQYLLLATVCYALMNVCVKFIWHIPVMEVVLFRCFICLIASYTHLKLIRQDPWGNNKKALILRGILGTISLTAFFFTLQRIPLASAVTIQYLSPIFTIILATFIVKEKTNGFQYLFFLVSFIGVIFIKGFDTRISFLDLGAGVLSAFCSGCAYNLIRKTAKTEHPMVVVFYFPLVALPFAIIGTCFDFEMPSGSDWTFLFLTGVFTQLGQTFMTMALQQEKASGIVNLQYTGVIFSLVFGFFIFNESYPLLSFSGMLLIIMGIILNFFYTKYTNKPTGIKTI